MADHIDAVRQQGGRERSGFLRLWDRLRRASAGHPEQAGDEVGDDLYEVAAQISTHIQEQQDTLVQLDRDIRNALPQSEHVSQMLAQMQEDQEQLRQEFAQLKQAVGALQQAERASRGDLREDLAVLGLHPEDFAGRSKHACLGLIQIAFNQACSLHNPFIQPDVEHRAHAIEIQQRAMRARSGLTSEYYRNLREAEMLERTISPEFGGQQSPGSEANRAR